MLNIEQEILNNDVKTISNLILTTDRTDKADKNYLNRFNYNKPRTSTTHSEDVWTRVGDEVATFNE